MKYFCGNRSALWVVKETYIRDLYHVRQSFQADAPFDLRYFLLFLEISCKYKVPLVNAGRCVSTFSLVGWAIWAIQSLSYGSYPDFQPAFSPTGFSFPACFFWPPSDSRICVNCCSAQSLVLCRIFRSCIRLQNNVSLQLLVLGLNCQNKPNGFFLVLCTAW